MSSDSVRSGVAEKAQGDFVMLPDFQIGDYCSAAGVEEVTDNHLGQPATDLKCEKDEEYGCLEVETFTDNCCCTGAGDVIDPESLENGYAILDCKGVDRKILQPLN